MDCGPRREEETVADAALFIGFGEVVRGREKRALKNFNDSTEYYTGLQNEGRIESFDVLFLGRMHV
jgi:hypothetical protein